ncbi:hypothetical protein ACXR8U_13675 [Methylobacterium radiotolerans]|jgi:hypothetical protein|uniref:hypothetical protein n=2 Tax=Methylobacterium TaxID=407 RepID=UPI0005E588E3|nr:hypothetical protein [Methylobacterium radiotolerans]OXE40241.1 hypothetical protein CCS92_19585 [Methylobacterium radiotolerans]GAN52661.1 serum resistance protein A1 [Methylobacterium sp. ME121]
MRKLILALTALACLTVAADAQQQPKFTVDQGTSPWSISGSIGIDQTAPGTSNAVSVASPAPTTDASGTIIAANTSQNVVEASATRSFLQIHNPDATTPVGFAFNRPAVLNGVGTIMLAPGATVTYDTRVPTGIVTIIGGTAGKPYTIYFK